MDEKKVSIIVPAYNSEKYLSDCISTIRNQTYRNLEIIIINDGSKDNTLSVAKGIAKQDNRVIVLNQENKGIAATRNRGIKEATGVYLAFSDNDDSMDPDYIRTMVAKLERHDSDMVVGGYRRVDQAGKILSETSLKDVPWAKFRIVAPWARIMKRSFILEHDIWFGDYKVGEDSFFSITAYNESNKITITEYTGYNWIYRNESVSNTVQRKAITSPIPFLEGLLERNAIEKNTPKEMLEYFVIKFLVWNLLYILPKTSGEEFERLFYQYFKWLSRKIPEYRSNCYLHINRPHGEKFFIRVVVTCMTKMPTTFILRILRCVRRMHF